MIDYEHPGLRCIKTCVKITFVKLCLEPLSHIPDSVQLDLMKRLDIFSPSGKILFQSNQFRVHAIQNLHRNQAGIKKLFLSLRSRTYTAIKQGSEQVFKFAIQNLYRNQTGV